MYYVATTSDLHKIADILTTCGVRYAITGHADEYIEGGAVPVITDGDVSIVVYPVEYVQPSIVEDATNGRNPGSVLQVERVKTGSRRRGRPVGSRTLS